MSGSRLAHNVFFKLKDSSEANVAALVASCKKYLNLQPGIVFFAVGPLCKELNRDVNDQNWDVGLHLVLFGIDPVEYDVARIQLDVIEDIKGFKVNRTPAQIWPKKKGGKK